MGWGEGCIEDIYANAAEHFVELIPSQVGVYFLRRGTNSDCGQQSSQRLFCERRCFQAKIHSVGSTYPSPPNLEEGTYVRQQQRIGETCTKHGATAANW